MSERVDSILKHLEARKANCEEVMAEHAVNAIVGIPANRESNEELARREYLKAMVWRDAISVVKNPYWRETRSNQ